MKNQETGKRLKAEGELKLTLESKATIQKELERITDEKKGLESALGKIKEEIGILTEQYSEEKRMKESLTVKLNETEDEIKNLQSALGKEKEGKSVIANKLTEKEKEYGELDTQFRCLMETKKKLEDELKQLVTSKKGEVELEKIVVKSRKDLKGEVLVVNKEFNFAVVNLGEKDGIKIGDIFMINRGDKQLGKVKVEKAHDKMSVATILPETKEGSIKEGDTAALAQGE